MSSPSPAPSDTRTHSSEIPEPTSDQPFAINPPHISARSPSGHLLPPSPAPARRRSRDNYPWLSGSQTSLHEEPSLINHEASQVPNDSVCRTSSSTTVYTHHSNLPTQLSRPPSPSFNSTVGASPKSAHIHFDAKSVEPHQGAPHLRQQPSRLSVARSFDSRGSIGRASYREYHGPPARPRTPISDHHLCSPSSASLNRLESDHLATFTPEIAPPAPNNPDQPGTPARFRPISACHVLRYEDHRKIRSPSESEQDYGIEAMSYQYPETPVVPEGWTAFRHPEGARYFVHDESKTITEVDICDEDILRDIAYFRDFLFTELEAEIRNRNLSESLKVDQIQVVLEPQVDEEGVMCCYYFVNPAARCIFWLDEWDGVDIFRACRTALSTSQKGLAIQAEYWSVIYIRCRTLITKSNSRRHWDLYPNLFKVTHELKDEMVDMLLHATCDHLTSNSSACPLSAEELKNHLALVERINPDKTSNRGHCVVIMGRIMHNFYHAYFVNYHGEDCARLDFDQTVYGWRYYPSLLMTVFAPLLFMAPAANVRLLHRIFVDEILSKEKWNMFITKLNSQLQETRVLATVLLNANVAFLPKQSGSASSYLSYMSLVASTVSIILGLVFVGTSRTEERSTPFDAANFLHKLRHETHGLETLAIIYSLPQAFLMWGLALFFTSFVVQWFVPIGTASRIGFGGFMLILVLVIILCAWIVRDKSDLWWFQPGRNPAGVQDMQEDKSCIKVPLCWTLLRGFKRTLTHERIIGEGHSMHQIGSSHDVFGSRNNVTEPNLRTGSHATLPIH